MAIREGSAGLAFHASEGIFGDIPQSTAGMDELCKSAAVTATGASAQIPLCPVCGPKSTKIFRDGVRKLKDGKEVQRYLCNVCGLRFSAKVLKSNCDLTSSRQICAIGAKNLSSATEIKTVAGDEKKKNGFPFAVIRNIDLIAEEPRGLLIKFMAYLEREGYSPDIQYPATLAHLAKDGANLLDPESVKTVIAKQKKKNKEPWSNSMKMLATCAYDAFCEMQGIIWKRPKYVQNEATVYLPDEKELDLLISAAPRKKMATFLRTLKETLADPSEIAYAEWSDWKNNVLSINHPVKGHYAGKYELTPTLAAMIDSMPRKSKRIFATNYDSLYRSFSVLRERAAKEFQNPALLKITFKSFRHWGGTMLAYLTKGNVPEMARVLRHKNWKSTQKYVHLTGFPWKEEDFETTSVTTPDEILALGKDGWQKYDEAVFNGVQYHFYRKPKRLCGLQSELQKQVHKSENAVDKFLCAA